MNLLAHAQELARDFNEKEAVQHEAARHGLLRRLLHPQAALLEEAAEALDWQQARSTCCQVRAIGYSPV